MDGQPSAVPGSNQPYRSSDAEISKSLEQRVPSTVPSERPSEQRELPLAESSFGEASRQAADFLPFILPDRSRDEIATRMKYEGFPELELLWKAHCKTVSGLDPLPTHETTVNNIERHIRPLFGFPRTAMAGLAVSGMALSHLYFSVGAPIVSATLSAPLSLWLGANLTVLGGLALCGLQRFRAVPLMRTMSDAVGTMLARRNFRLSMLETERFVDFAEKRAELKISPRFDDPDYQKFYQRSGNNWVEVDAESPEAQIHKTLQRFLGYMDPVKRTFVPGECLPHLRDGKKSVTRFISHYKAELALSKNEQLPIERGVGLLRALATEEIRDGSAGMQIITGEIERFVTCNYVPRETIMAKVWERDPWSDLTHQEEFFSSASLRGVKKMGRDSKGRLGTFGYLYNPSISALDLSTDKGRLVRVRCGLATVSHRDNNFRVLFVDGVEGSNAISLDVVFKAATDYAKACGVEALCVNAFSHNVTPQKFAQFVKASGAPLRRILLEYLDSSTREYLDTFGLPIQPFEYAYPRGKALAYVVSLGDNVPQDLPMPSRLDLMQGALRRNCVWAYFGQAMAGAAVLIGSSMPAALIPFGALAGAGAFYQRYFQHRSQRSAVP